MRRSNEARYHPNGNWDCMTKLVVGSLYRETGIYDTLDKEWRKRADREDYLAANPAAPLTRREIRESYVPPFSPFSILYSIAVGAHSGRKISKKAEKINELRRNVEAGTNISTLRPEGLVGRMALSLTRPGETGYFAVDTGEMLEAMEASDPLERGEGVAAEIEELLRTFTTLAPRPMSLLDQRAFAANVFMGSRMLNEPGTENALDRIVGPQLIEYVAADPHTLGIRISDSHLPHYESKYRPELLEESDKSSSATFVALPLLELVEASRI